MKNYTVSYEINTDANLLFQALTSSETFAKWSGQPAEIEPEINGDFSQFNGNIVGSFIEVSPSKIVQSWKEGNWKEFSKVTFTITESNGKSILKVFHEEIPDESYNMIEEGWDKYYLGQLKKYFEN